MSGKWTGVWIGLLAGAAALLLLHGAVFASGGAYIGNSETGSAAEPAQRFRSTANNLYSAVVNGDRSGSYYELVKLAKLAGDRGLRSHGYSAGWAAVDKSLSDAKAALSAGTEADKLLEAASRLRLAADSLAGGGEALWLQYEPLLKEDARQVAIAWTTSGSLAKSAAAARLATLERHWEVIEPAVLLSRDPLQAEAMREAVAYSGKLLKASGDPQSAWIIQSFRSVSETADTLFRAAGSEGNDATEPAVAPPASPNMPGGWMLYALVPLIAAVLGYAGWSNYRGGQHGVRVHPAKGEPPSHNGVARK
ncbi:hypothetical protein VE23_02770 [Paenibacillus sp. D9]|uniref:sporulation protein YpjB n=1 Tax=Paenibacillus sp. D9 TaxID=665792 RepID=UPI00061EA819|nr:sporulation protein YpjB [Paenibacillus sp. D9]KKC46282.1 hypothetical protein VE23_02770 [Paenibacillus sp. D9]